MKLYRGFNNNYPNLGVRPEQKGIWLTDDEDFAKVYADYFKNGAIAEVELDDNANIANEYECMSVFEDDEDWQDMAEYICDLGGDTVMDNQVCNKLADCGYDGVMFDDSGVDCYYVFNRKMIKGSKIIKKVHNNREDAMESLYEGLANKPVSFTAYHGGVEPDMTPDEGRAFYLTDSYNLALQFARREIYDDGLYVGEIPTVFTFKGTFNNPYYLTDDEYDSEGQDSNIDYEKWVGMGVDGLVYEGQGGSTYYIVIDLSTIKLVDKKVFEDEAILDEQAVYAGSGVQYDTPSLDAFGSNTGDAVHGYGLYFAKNPKVAKKYRNNSNGTQWLYNEEPFLENIGKYTDYDLSWDSYNREEKSKINNAKSSKELVSILIKDLNKTISNWEENDIDTNGLKKFKNILQNIDLNKLVKKDEGMEITVDVPDDEYLMSEASFDSQSSYVKQCLKNMIQSEGMNIKDLKHYRHYPLSYANEGQIYQYVMSFLSGKDRYELYGEQSSKYQKLASELLYKYGIKGIRYTGSNDGRCVVIFNPKDIKVLDRKGKGLDESKQYDLSDKSNMADSLRCLQIWADRNEGMIGIDNIPPARAWEGLSNKQKKNIIKQHNGDYWDGDTTSDWVANELEKNGFPSDYDSKYCDDFRKILNEDISSDLFNVLLESNILTEDIAAVKKYFPKVPEEKIQSLIELDPTYQGGDNLGKFGKWILGLYNKGQLKDEDFYKVPQYLTTFKDNLKKIQNKDIMSYKTLPDLAQAIQPYEGQKDVSKKQQVKQLKSDEAEKVLETSNWLIVHPKTHKADCYYGANTKWCTASKDSDNWFNDYNEKGPLFVLINKKNGKKYQFHFETLSFMDELDRPINPEEIFGYEDDNETRWFINYVQEHIDVIIENYNKDAYEEIYDGGIGYSVQQSIETALDQTIYADDMADDLMFDTSQLARWWDDTQTMFEFWNGIVRNYLDDHKEFHEEVEDAVVDFTDENAFITDTKNFLKNDDLYANKEFKQMLFRNLSDAFEENYGKKIEEQWSQCYGEYDIDGGSMYQSVSMNEIINDIYERGEIDPQNLTSYIDEKDRLNYTEIDRNFQKIFEKTIIQTIKDWTKSENQMEFKFDESVKNRKNPFLED